MLLEAREAPNAVATQLAHNDQQYHDFGALLRQQPPSSVLTVARGSSDHAAHFMAYLIMARLGRLVTSLPMSLITLYQSQIVCDGLVSMAFSQSGQSPDLVAPTRFFSEGGARTAAFVNDPDSPLAKAFFSRSSASRCSASVASGLAASRRPRRDCARGEVCAAAR